MKVTHRRWLAGGVFAVTGFILVLWSWNTLATFFGLPDAQAKHVLAALFLLGTIRFALLPRTRGASHRTEQHERPTH